MGITLDRVNDLISGSGYLVTLVSVEVSSLQTPTLRDGSSSIFDSKAQYAWVDNKNNPLFHRGTLSSLVEAAREELGNRFIRQYGLDFKS